MRKVLALIDATNTRIGKAVSILSLVVAFIISYEIIMREVFVKPTLWVAEGTVFGCGLVYMLGGAWTLRLDGHVRVDMLYHGLSRRRKALVDCLTYFAFLLYIVVMIWASWQYMVQSIAVRETTMSPWDPVIWPFKRKYKSRTNLAVCWKRSMTMETKKATFRGQIGGSQGLMVCSRSLTDSAM